MLLEGSVVERNIVDLEQWKGAVTCQARKLFCESYAGRWLGGREDEEVVGRECLGLLLSNEYARFEREG